VARVLPRIPSLDAGMLPIANRELVRNPAPGRLVPQNGMPKSFDNLPGLTKKCMNQTACGHCNGDVR
jgi:hypothetical protein